MKNMSTAVREILDRIMRLPDADRMELSLQLARQDEQEWTELLREARQAAKQRGLDDQAITRAVESLRYGDDDVART